MGAEAGLGQAVGVAVATTASPAKWGRLDLWASPERLARQGFKDPPGPGRLDRRVRMASMASQVPPALLDPKDRQAQAASPRKRISRLWP